MPSTVALTEGELRSYRELGYAGPFPLFDDQGIDDVLREWDRTRDHLPWYKGHHVYRGPIVDALRSDAVVGRVASVLGDDLMLWGSQVMAKRGGEVHRWHVDIETMEWTSINFWAALRNVTADATVLLLPRTQRLTVSPQELERTEGLDLTDTQAVRRAAIARGIETELVTVDIPPGTFVIFDGHLWHGSVNNTTKLRSALLAQFSPTTARAKIPRTYVPPIEWDPTPAPCLLVRGTDVGGINTYVEPTEPPARRPTIFGVRRAVDHLAQRVTKRIARPATTRRTVSVCIVGTGGAAARHVHALRQQPGLDVRISAVGRDPDRVAAWVARHAATRGYRSIDEAMEAADDIVVIATPPSSHADYLDRAMAAGKHVLVEKPAVRSLDELIPRLAAIRAYKPAWMVAENSHFSPMHRLVLARVRDGAIGNPLVTTLRRLRRRLPAEGWKALDTESSGALNEGGIHWIRVGLALTGVTRPADVEWVFAAQPGQKTIDNHGDDTAVVTWRARTGALGELAHSWGLEGGRMLLRSAVIGTEGAIYFDVSGRFATISRGHSWAQRPLVPWHALRAREDLTGTFEMWRSFLESVRSGAPVAHTIDEAAADLGVVEASYRAMTSQAAQPLDARLG
ncbi:MAG: Gfo/Idh/MocA family oxidoreductase [Proteobacteria bacterium]|nr:Gfo/Idh/MocA family oxidoreductase [Pseudomonadota bacterium]